MVRVEDLNAEDSSSKPKLGRLNKFVLGDPRVKFIVLFLIAKLLGFLTGGEGDFNMTLKSPLWGVVTRYLFISFIYLLNIKKSN